MADNVLLKLFKKEVDYQDLILWLLKDTTPTVLEDYDDHRPTFVTYFLAFLRESSAAQKQDCVHSGLTPRKVPTDRNNKNRSHISNKVGVQEPYLRHSLGDPKSECHETKVSDPQCPRSRPKTIECKSRQKLSLGSFIKSIDNNQSSSNSSFLKNYDLENIDDFPTIGSRTQKRERTIQSRRITPTPVLKRVPELHQNSNRHAAFSSSSREVDTPASFDEERNLLRKERLNMKTNVPPADKIGLLCSTSSKSSLTNVEVILPHDVSFKCHLDNFIKLYAALIQESLVPSLYVETYFLFQLLTIPGIKSDPDAKQNGNCDEGLDSLLKSAANLVYFASHTLFLLRKFLIHLDSYTIRLLSENCRVQLFCPSLAKYLKNHLVSSNWDNQLTSCLPSTIQGVAFHSDTNNRRNFINEQEFHIFKKKRDLFYSLIREWETNHDDSNWSMELSMSSKIKSLVGLGDDPTSYMQFARLFVAQLVVMCKDDYLSEDKMKADILENLIYLKGSNPEKIRMLEKRFRIPLKSGGVLPQPSFPSYQGFFKTFIRVAASSNFNQHLGDILGSDIKEIYESLTILVNGFSAEKLSIDHVTGMKALSIMMTLKLLAKFLGLVVFLPYTTVESVAKEAEKLLASSRTASQPIFDFLGLVKLALVSGELYLLLFWLVDFLSMMDCVAPKLVYYQSLIRCCSDTYTFLSHVKSKLNKSYCQFLVRLLLEWLFQVIRSRCGESALEVVSHSQPQVEQSDSESSHMQLNNITNMDFMRVVGERALYLICPYLEELKYLLTDFSNGVSSNNSFSRKIKPISTSSSSALASSKHLEIKLEENFLHNQPASIKRIVDVISDNVSTNVIKHSRDNIIPEFRRGVSTQLNEMGVLLNEEDEDILKSIKLTSANIIVELANLMTEDVRKAVTNFSNSYCPSRVQATVEPLLTGTMSEITLKTVVKVTLRFATQKVYDWMNTHVIENLFYKEMLREVQKSQKGCIPNVTILKNAIRINEAHNSSLPLPSDVIIATKELLRRLWDNRDRELSVNNIYKNLQLMTAVLENRQDINILTLKTALQLNVDLAICLGITFFAILNSITVVCQPRLLTEDLQKGFISLWKKWQREATQLLQTAICVRNFYLFYYCSLDVQLTWTKWTQLTSAMMNNKLLAPMNFQESCSKIIQQTFWSEDFLPQLSTYKEQYSCIGIADQS